MNYSQDSTQGQTSVVTFSNIPLDDEPVAIGFDTIPESMESAAPTEISVIGVQFKKGGKIYYFDPCSLEVAVGTEVIIDTARGAEYGFCAEANHMVPIEKVVQPLRQVIRIATDTDKRTREEYKSREPAAFDLCQEKILERQLDMKLVSAEYSFDGSKILFYFTADGRVDFRELVKDLASVFRTRIELRQIGVRDEAKMMGGLGICGRPFCCKQFLDDFQPVSIKMAKVQGLSLNPTKISGTCGRLMCCLKYEQDAYEDLIKNSPKQDSIVNTCDGKGTVTDVNLLKESVKVRLDSDGTTKCYQNCDICVLRNGKGKKTDPPIPEDLPPLPKPEAKPADDEAAHASQFHFADSSTVADTASRTERQNHQERQNRGERANRTERQPRLERPSRQNRTENTEHTEQPENSPRTEAHKPAPRQERTERLERPERKRRTDPDGRVIPAAAAGTEEIQSAQPKKQRQQGQHSSRRFRSERAFRNEKSENAEKVEKVEKAETLEKTDKAGKAEKTETSAKTEKSEKSRSHNGHRRYYRGKKSSGGGKSEQNQ